MWKSRGIVFDLEMDPVQKLGLSFAQGPQALVMKDRTRVYFSTRKPDSNGKPISFIKFVEFSPDFTELLRTSEAEVVSPGELGAFDEHGIFPLNVIPVNDEIRGYSSGWSRRVSVDVTMGIGILSSRDGGLSFQRTGLGPSLSAGPDEPYLIGDPFVLLHNGKFHLWYIYGTAWTRDSSGVPERTYRIGHRESDNGVNWEEVGKTHDLIAPMSPFEAQAMPSVLVSDGKGYLVFCYRDTFDFRSGGARSYRLGLAVSSDIESWTRIPNFGEWQSEGWDSQMMCYPNIHVRGDIVYLLYNGNDFGKNGFGLAEIPLGDFVRHYGAAG
jgi:hypothetical protein